MANGCRSFGRPKKLFPELVRKKTAKMVKRDLLRAGIPYVTDHGVADFHAAGRHTYIAELLRNEVSLVEAKEFARHTDVNMTMRYTHIGLSDRSKEEREQARAPCICAVFSAALAVILRHSLTRTIRIIKTKTPA
ncbi:MAG: tyrosine-type recombinase/integrase [Gemmataceae bacterium]|nr:tyrosine-type recombinase/integrase [Gemmataceae bacterium]